MLTRFRGQGRKKSGAGPDCDCRPEGLRNQCDVKVLTQLRNGCRCRIRRHASRGAIRQRLLDLGFLPDTEVEMIRCATLGDPLELRVGNYYVTMRKKEADLIEVQ
ncbi:MAG: FeoA family protein [Desulfonatronovibrio sp.]